MWKCVLCLRFVWSFRKGMIHISQNPNLYLCMNIKYSSWQNGVFMRENCDFGLSGKTGVWDMMRVVIRASQSRTDPQENPRKGKCVCFECLFCHIWFTCNFSLVFSSFCADEIELRLFADCVSLRRFCHIFLWQNCVARCRMIQHTTSFQLHVILTKTMHCLSLFIFHSAEKPDGQTNSQVLMASSRWRPMNSLLTPTKKLYEWMPWWTSWLAIPSQPW